MQIITEVSALLVLVLDSTVLVPTRPWLGKGFELRSHIHTSSVQNIS